VGLTAVVLLLACGLLATAFLRGFSDNRCFLIDHAEVVDELREGNQIFYLVYRITGWHDKVAFYELYATLPSFDTCGHPKDEPLDGYVIDDTEARRNEGRMDEGRMVKDVLVRNTKYGKKLEVRYTRQADEGVEPNHAKLIPGDTVKPNPEDNPREWDTEDTTGADGE